MANEMTVMQHNCEGLLRFIILDDTVTIDIEIMTLKGIHILNKIRTPVRKLSSLGVKTTNPPPHF